MQKGITKEDIMRAWTLAALVSAVVALSTAHADTAWQAYIANDHGFSFMAPGEVKASLGTYRGALAGPRQTIVYRSVDNNIEYKVTVMSFLQAQAEGASILGEREYTFQDKKKVLMDTFGRVESGKDAVYGRKLVVDQPDNKGRTTGAFYFTKGKMISLEATVLPANGNYASPDPGRFVDSIVFVLSRADKNAVVLPSLRFE
jgi:hypothetical protein